MRLAAFADSSRKGGHDTHLPFQITGGYAKPETVATEAADGARLPRRLRSKVAASLWDNFRLGSRIKLFTRRSFRAIAYRGRKQIM